MKTKYVDIYVKSNKKAIPRFFARRESGRDYHDFISGLEAKGYIIVGTEFGSEVDKVVIKNPEYVKIPKRFEVLEKEYDERTIEENNQSWEIICDSYDATFDELINKGYSFKEINYIMQQRKLKGEM